MSRSLKSLHDNPFLKAIKSSGAVASSSSSSSVSSAAASSSSSSSSNPFLRKSKIQTIISDGDTRSVSAKVTSKPEQFDTHHSNPFSKNKSNAPTTAVDGTQSTNSANPFAANQMSSNPFLKQLTLPSKSMPKQSSVKPNPFLREPKSSSVPAKGPGQDSSSLNSNPFTRNIRSSSDPSTESNIQRMLSNPFINASTKLPLFKPPSYAQIAAGQKPPLQQSSGQDKMRHVHQKPLPPSEVTGVGKSVSSQLHLNSAPPAGPVPLIPHLQREEGFSGQQLPQQRRSEFAVEGQGAVVAPGSGISTATALHLKGLPQDINNKAVLMGHFSKFGAVSVKCNTAKMYATVSFKTHVSGDHMV